MNEYGERTYTCQNGESLDSIALKIWGDEKYAAELTWANPTEAGKIVFGGGEVLRIPDVDIPEEGSAGDIAPWRR